MTKVTDIQQLAVDEILSLLPEHVGSFHDSEFPLPVRAALLGNKEISLEALRHELIQKRDGDVKDLLDSLLLAAELCEAARDDKDRFFLTDREVQSAVFMGSKWRAGWALALGGQDQNELVAKLQERDFMVFTDVPDLPNTTFIGSRPTSPIYFLQLMVRYGLVWGNIAPGDDHEMSHFLEKDLPGLIMLSGELPPLKYLITLGLMKLGAPAVVPSTFPFPYGNRVMADRLEDVLEKGCRFPNLRQRYYKDEIIRLPDFCNPAFASEKFEASRRLGGQPHSFFCVQPVRQVGKRVTVRGQPSEDVGILVQIAHEDLSDDIALMVEKVARKTINFISGVRALERDELLHIELRKGVELDPEQVADAIYWGIRMEYPRLEQIAVHIIYDSDLLASEAENVKTYKRARDQFVKSITEDNSDTFYACTECRPFSLVHTCIVTPERQPMCGARTYNSVKAAAYLGSAFVPWKRRSEEELPLRYAFPKGRVLDAQRGEYEGCNQVYQEMTHGQLQRVYLHSLRDFPHTSCGCFQALAFWIEEVKGIGIMLRGSEAITPSGANWEQLANRAGGKQSPGIMGVSVYYIRSARFLQGDGGIHNVVWLDSGLYKRISDKLLPGQRVATEKDVQTVGQLKDFLEPLVST